MVTVSTNQPKHTSNTSMKISNIILNIWWKEFSKHFSEQNRQHHHLVSYKRGNRTVVSRLNFFPLRFVAFVYLLIYITLSSPEFDFRIMTIQLAGCMLLLTMFPALSTLLSHPKEHIWSRGNICFIQARNKLSLFCTSLIYNPHVFFIIHTHTKAKKIDV